MSFSKTFIDRPIATSLVMAAILLAGILGFTQLPLAALPRVDFPTVSVGATLPGADPTTMASSVAAPLERQFAQISGLSQMTSISTLGNTSVTLQFDLDRNIDAAAQDVQSAINAAGGQLPKDLPSPPTYRKTNPADAPILILGVHSDELPIDQVDDYTDNYLAQQISQLEGVGQVIIFGEQKPAVRVQIDPAAIANQGLSLEDVRTVLGNTTTNAPKGNLNGQYLASTLASNDQILTAKDYKRVVIAYRNGAPVHVEDVGTAIDSVENNQLAAWADKPRGIVVGIFRQPGANVIATADLVKRQLPQLRLAIPKAVKVEVMQDRTLMIRASVNDVERTMMITIVLVVLVIFLFLRKLWATVIPSIAVPLALVGTFGVMFLFSYSLDNLSLMALTIAVGFVVDDAIVMIENIVRYIEKGENAYDASVKGSAEIGFTIISISISLIAVFIPLLLMGGIVGRLFHEFAVTLSMAVIISAFVSLTLTPTMCARFLGQHEEHNSRFFTTLERFFDWLVNGYARMLRIVLRHRVLTLVVFFATLALTIVLFATMPKGFFPQQDTGLLFASTEAAQNISFDDMLHKQEEAAAILRADPAMGTVPSAMGANGGGTTNTGRMFPSLKPFDQRTASADEVVNRLMPQLAKLNGFKVHLQVRQDITVGGRLSRTQYQYTLQDADSDELSHWSNIMLQKMSKIPQLEDVATDEQLSGPTSYVKVDRETASRLGITPQQIDDTLYDAFGQRQVATTFTQLNQYHVILEAMPKDQRDPEALNKIYVKSAITGAQVPLSTFTHFEQSTSPLSVSHQGQFPAVTLSFNLAPGVALGDAVALIQKAADEVHLPHTVTPSFQGNAQAFQASLVTMPYLIMAALVAVYIVLGVLYESYIHPLTILSTLPSAGVGALLMLTLFGFPLDMMGLIGIILLIGIVKKNAIMMIDFALEAERHQGLSPEDSIYQAALLRFRPIMMTTMAALFGGIPLALAHGAGSELRRPLGVAIVGGLIVSQALTLFTTPVVYLYLDRLNNWLSGRKHDRNVPALHDEPPVPMHLSGAAE
ncbi:MAG TPA: multidrug efflux RND transporter permease subunit [Alphaproteobacteria bacterium]|nr:multidrug efflux RND transporter permease subunit [Alphaproteobacteria bacterium]